MLALVNTESMSVEQSIANGCSLAGMSQPTPQRIALFLPSLRGGGAERAMLLFAKGLIARGYLVDIVVAQATGALVREVPTGARLIDFQCRKVSFSIPKLYSYLRSEKPEAVYSSIVNANITAIISSLLCRTFGGFKGRTVVRESNVVTPEGQVSLPRRVAGFLAPRLYSFADAIISVSHDVATELTACLPSLSSRLFVLPNPVISEEIFKLSAEPAAHEWLRDPQVDGNIPIIVGAGRLHPQKDFTTLIEAFALVVANHPARLIILGEGEERPKLEAQIDRLGLNSCVSLPGFVANPFPYLKRADTFVLSSRYEGMPNVLLQAMAFGTAVVATRCHSGACEVVTSDEFGRLVSPGEPAEMARAIESCLHLPKSAGASELVSNNFSVKRATAEYLLAAGL